MLNNITSIIADTLLIDTSSFLAETPLMGALPELDSVGVIMILTALQEQFGIAIADDEIDATIFETVGSLVAFVEAQQ